MVWDKTAQRLRAVENAKGGKASALGRILIRLDSVNTYYPTNRNIWPASGMVSGFQSSRHSSNLFRYFSGISAFSQVSILTATFISDERASS